MPSPTCTVNATATTNGVNVAAASAPAIALSDTAGVTTWTLECVGRDEDAAAPTITINSVNKTATFTAGALGSAYILKSVVNGGRDANGTLQASYSTTFAVYVLTGAGARVVASNETTEGNTTHGWIDQVNTSIRLPASSYGPAGSAPTAGQAGRIRVENSSVQPLYVDDGTQWRPIIGGSLGYVPPLAAAFTVDLLGTATYTDRGWTGELKSNSPGVSDVLGKAVASGATPYTVTAHFKQAAADCKFGLLFRQSSDGKLHLNECDTGYSLVKSDKWDNASTYNATYAQPWKYVYQADIWLRIADDGASRICSWSHDGRNFYVIHTIGRTDFLTADQVGWYQRDTGNLNTTVTLVSWKQT